MAGVRNKNVTSSSLKYTGDSLHTTEQVPACEPQLSAAFIWQKIVSEPDFWLYAAGVYTKKPFII